MVDAVRDDKMFFSFACVALFACTGLAEAAVYDPLAVSERQVVKTIELAVEDAARQREIPVLVYLPREKTAVPVVLFSHGLGGSRAGSAFLGRHWAARGYVAVFLQHAGSDTAVWQDKPLRDRMAAMKRAASLQNFRLRAQDVSAVLDQLERWNEAADHELAERLDLQRVGMSGHSFGAVTTQAVSGQGLWKGKALLSDLRIRAAIMLSPSSPRVGKPGDAFGSVKIPWMLMTGTKDVAIIGHADVKSRLAVFPALPPGGKYELVLENAEHSAFTERALPGDTQPRNPNHHRSILALSTAFWDAWLREAVAARAWLNGEGPREGPREVLEEGDSWQTK